MRFLIEEFIAREAERGRIGAKHLHRRLALSSSTATATRRRLLRCTPTVKALELPANYKVSSHFHSGCCGIGRLLWL